MGESSTQNITDPFSQSRLIGRPYSEYWRKLNYKPAYAGEDAKIKYAKCGICGVLMRNTSHDRLRAHRRKCIDHTNQNDFGVLDEPTPTKRPRLPEATVEELKKQFEDVRNEQGRKIGRTCLKCGKIVTNTAVERMKSHKCCKSFNEEDQLPDTDNESDHNESLPDTQKTIQIIKIEALSEFVQCGNQMVPDSPQDDLEEKFEASTSEPAHKTVMATPRHQQQVNVDAVLTDLFYGTSLPFDLVENDLFKKFVGRLNAGTKLPTSKQLATSLLEKSFIRCTAKVKPSKGHSILLLEMFSSETANTKLVGFLNNHEKQRIFLKEFHCEHGLDTNDYFLKCLNEMYRIAEEKYKTKVYAVLWNNLESIDPNRNISVWHFTSSFYLANRLANEFIDDNLRRTVLSIFEEFRQPQLEEKLVESGCNEIQMESASENCLVYLNLCKTLLSDLECLKLIATNKFNQVCPIVSKKLFDEAFIDDLNDLLLEMLSLHTLMEVSLDTTTTLGDIAEQWLTLVPPHNRVDWHKYQMLALNKYVIVANYLHPKYLGANLMSHHLDIIDEFLMEQLAEEGLTSLENLRNKRGVFETLLEKNVQSPITFWNFAERKHRELSYLALKLHRIPVTAGKSLTKLQLPSNTERLSEDSYEKLVFLYFFLAFNNTKAKEW